MPGAVNPPLIVTVSPSVLAVGAAVPPAAYKYVLDVSCIKSITDWLTARKRYVNAASRSRGEPSREEKLNVRLILAAVVPVLVLQPMTELSEPFSTRKP